MSTVYCYTDGACGDYCAGIGYTIGGAISVTGNRTIDENITSMEAELHAVLEAVRVATVECEDCEMITVYTDAKPLIEKIDGSRNSSQKWEEYRQSFIWLSNKFDSFEIKYVRRENNKDAHRLARKALKRGRNNE